MAEKAPAAISLLAIVEEFERQDTRVMCPFGPSWCGHGEPCPMHDTLVRMDDGWKKYLADTTLAVFQPTEFSRRQPVKASAAARPPR